MDTSTTTTASAPTSTALPSTAQTSTDSTATASGGARPAGVRDLEPLLTIADLASYLGVPKQTIYDWRVTGRGPRAHRIGKHLRYTVRDIREWVDAQHEPSAATPPGG